MGGRRSTDRAQPREGRCNAELTNEDGSFRGYCHGTPPKGTSRCRIHGGAAQSFGARLRALDKAAQDEVDAAIKDPDLLDTRRPIAVIEAVITRTALIASDDRARARAKRKLLSQIPPEVLQQLLADEKMRDEFLTPTDDDIEDARLELHERSVKMLAVWSKRQVDAVRQLEWSRVIREVALPLMGELGINLSKLVRKYIPEDQAERFIDELRQEIRRTVGALSLVKDAK